MRRNFKQIRFILCESCFWCASCLNQGITVDKCPICNNGNVESMSVFDNELDRSNLNPKKMTSYLNLKQMIDKYHFAHRNLIDKKHIFGRFLNLTNVRNEEHKRLP